MNDKKNKILIVDDEEDLCEIIQFNLNGEGYDTDVASSAEAVLKMDLGQYKLILLDVMMGQISGFKLADIMRKELKLSTPIIFITAKTTENDLLTGFSLGADDYITKPFSIKELTARVKAVLSRSKSQDYQPDQVLKIEDVELNFNKKELIIKGQAVSLTRKEFEILNLLMSNTDRIFSREEILRTVWEDDIIVTDRTVDVHISRLRKKMNEHGEYLKNKAGYGYCFDYS
ncbi:MAG: DNA-binding response regulator [Bacteroidetes bacterium HGW-Bacteroidetes-17]|jgi:DNA-binding response OmpR family regulator|nr:MAG: DNA-binding response regulator [Bacteroidetes bacterium HGW-Bacteroidetes-17]